MLSREYLKKRNEHNELKFETEVIKINKLNTLDISIIEVKVNKEINNYNKELDKIYNKLKKEKINKNETQRNINKLYK